MQVPGVNLFISDNDIVTLILIFTWIIFFWENYLNIRQRTITKNTTEPPAEIQSLMKCTSFKKARVYSIDKINFGIVRSLYSILQLSVVLHFRLLSLLWHVTENHMTHINSFAKTHFDLDLNLTKDNEIICSLIFISYVSLFTFFDSLPWSLYHTFVTEAKHGFNNQSIGFFLKDKIKGLFVSLLLMIPITSALLWIIKVGGDYFCLYAYGFTFCVSLLIMFIYPEFIAPLFDRYERFPDGELRTKIENLATQLSFPLKKLLVVEGSKRSSHSNAFFYGFGKNKRIVLFDTLIKGFKMPCKDGEIDAKVDETETNNPMHDKTEERGCGDDDEILAVLAHEMGHWKLNHITKHIIISQVNLLLMFISFGYLINIDQLYTGFGFTALSTPILIRLIIIFQFIFMPYNTILEFCMTIISRKFEFQADAFAVGYKPGTKLSNALIVLTTDNLSFPVYDSLYSLFNLSHPPVLERIKAIDAIELNKKKN